MTTTFTKEHKAKLQEYLDTHQLSIGLGDFDSACSIAAINLAISGKLTDSIPDCMSAIIGQWIIQVQDVMPDEMRNSVEWKQLLVDAAGTGRDKENERLALIADWMWDCFGKAQSVATGLSYGDRWAEMLANKDRASIRTVKTYSLQVKSLANDYMLSAMARAIDAIDRHLDRTTRIIRTVGAVYHLAWAIAFQGNNRSVTDVDIWETMNVYGCLRSLIDVLDKGAIA